MSAAHSPVVVAVTGAGGFVGRAVCARLVAAGFRVRGFVRSAPDRRLPEGVDPVAVGDLREIRDFAPLLEGVEAVVHLAARVHVMREVADDPWGEFVRSNVEVARSLGQGARRADVRRMLFMSTVKVHGEGMAEAYREADAPLPQGPYARSKLAAEEALRDLESADGLEVVVVRPPLVYGPGVGGNFRRLLWLAHLGARVPLPLGAIRNARSMVSVDNLAAAVERIVGESGRVRGVFLVRDDQDLSTPGVLRLLAAGVGRTVRLFPVPVPVLRTTAALAGRRGECERLCGSLRVDDSLLRARFGWRPPEPSADALARTAQWYGAEQSTARRALPHPTGQRENP